MALLLFEANFPHEQSWWIKDFTLGRGFSADSSSEA